MAHILAWIVEENLHPLATRPLLGKTCPQHVAALLKEAGLPLGEAQALSQPMDGLVLVRGDAPCLSSAALRALAAELTQGHTPAPLLDAQTQQILALALPQEAWQAALSKGADPQEAADLLLAMNEAAPSPKEAAPSPGSEGCFAVASSPTYAQAFSLLRQRIINRHLEAGVLILEPARTIIEAEVRIGRGCLVYPDNTLQGHTTIGEDCTLYPNNRMENATLGTGVTIESSVLLDCQVGHHTSVGPFAYLRPGTSIGAHCRIGDFVEVKNSTIGDKTKVSHLTYVGDSDLGKDINLGCGVVFVNYDGKTKKRSRVEDHAFIGCNCNLVAPVSIGKNAYLAAGSTVVEDVPQDALYLARSRGTIKPGWVKRRKDQGKL